MDAKADRTQRDLARLRLQRAIVYLGEGSGTTRSKWTRVLTEWLEPRIGRPVSANALYDWLGGRRTIPPDVQGVVAELLKQANFADQDFAHALTRPTPEGTTPLEQLQALLGTAPGRQAIADAVEAYLATRKTKRRNRPARDRLQQVEGAPELEC